MRNLHSVLTYIIYSSIIITSALFSYTCSAARQNLLLTQEGIGPINSQTPFSQQALEKMFPHLIVKKEQNASEGESFDVIVVYEAKQPLLTITPVDERNTQSKILCASFLSNSIKNSLGAKIGSRFSSIYSNATQAHCIPGMEEMGGSVICSAPSAKNIDYVFQGNWSGPDGQIPPLTILKNWTLKQITWLADDKYALANNVSCRAINLD